ncbi:DUF1629 domain-containing protein [uncultured Shewanella sp.]|uniref:imm11 family protein n=1 Tax=uncultured Shewanella sp. TaxID=173975 RepID=UPI002613A12A|nr:DUF1629 domain-containing protein [uncultured Shewanella sp.]
MYWVMFTERKSVEEKRLSGVPPLIDELHLKCNEGKNITRSFPVIEFTPKEDFHCLTDNLTAAGFSGLIANKRVSETLREIGVNNIQQFPVLLKEVNGNQDCTDYDLINIIGDADIVDYDKSDITLNSPGDIMLIDSLSFIDTSDIPLPYVFRLTSFLPLIIAHDKVKQAFETNNITGFTFYKPEDFYL